MAKSRCVFNGRVAVAWKCLKDRGLTEPKRPVVSSLMNLRIMAVLVAHLFSSAVISPLIAQEQSSGPSEYQVKAAFLFNFAKFVEWPPESFADTNSPIIIGVLGNNPFGEDLERTVRNKTVEGRPFVVTQLSSAQGAKNCHILFISSSLSDRRRLAEVLDAVESSPVLTVSEMNRFVQSGGMINFVIEDGRVHFEINNNAARQVGLRISSKLLSLARRTGETVR
jgi:hypothetical protein